MNKQVSALMVAILLLIPIYIPIKAEAEKSNETDLSYVDDIPYLSKEQWNELEKVVLENSSVIGILKDKQYKLYSEGYVRYLSNNTPVRVKSHTRYANIVYLYYLDNDEYLLSALVDHNAKKVVDTLTVKHSLQGLNIRFEDANMHTSGDFSTATVDPPSFSAAYYNGSATNIRRFDASAIAPSSYTGNSTAPRDLITFLLNATAKNSINSQLCDSSSTTSYWAQVGIAWIFSLKKIVWSDTKESCYVREYIRNIYGDGNRYIFTISSSTSSPYTWNICAINTTARLQECVQRNNISQGTFKTNDIHSSIWLENQNTTTNWYTFFGSNPQGGNAKYMKVGDGTLYNWDSASKIDQACDGSRYNGIVITGNVTNGQWATWDLKKIAMNYPAC